MVNLDKLRMKTGKMQAYKVLTALIRVITGDR